MAERDTILDVLDRESIAILQTVTSGTCALVDSEEMSRTPREITEQRILQEGDAQRLAELMLNIDSWFFAAKRCLPKGTATVRLFARAGDATVRIGMACADWELSTAHNSVWGFFDPVADDVRDILKRAFPEFASSERR
jgi:hypothetical protein